MIEVLVIVGGLVFGASGMIFGIVYGLTEHNKTNKIFYFAGGVIGIVLIILTFGFVAEINETTKQSFNNMNCLEKQEFIKTNESYLTQYIIDCVPLEKQP